MERDGPGARLLLTDLQVLFLLLNEARHRTLGRVFGSSREESNLVTWVLLGMVLVSTHAKVQTLKEPPSREALTNLGLATAVAGELLGELAGPAANDTPLFGELMLLAALGTLARPAVRAVRDWHPVHRGMVHFHHRYGHLLPTRRARLSAGP